VEGGKLRSAVERPFRGFSTFNVVGDRRRIGDMIAHLHRRFPGLVSTPAPAVTPPSGWGIRNDGLAAERVADVLVSASSPRRPFGSLFSALKGTRPSPSPGQIAKGAASVLLAERLSEGGRVPAVAEA